MNYQNAWREILEASGSELADLACEAHGHDLLDPEGPPNAPLDQTFAKLCRKHEVQGWGEVDEVLSLLRTVQGFESLRLPDKRISEIANLQAQAAGMPPDKIRGIAHHTSIQRGTYQSTWGTPSELIGAVIDMFGSIDLDLASSHRANETVRAKAFCSAENPCPTHPHVIPGQVVWCNPPGPCEHVAEFWDVWLGCVSRGARGGFLIFNVDHWRQLEAPGWDLPVVVLRKRLRFVGAKSQANFPSVLVLSDGDPPADLGHVVMWR